MLFRSSSVTQAVDLLVAYGVLPAELSSAYRDGLGEGTAAILTAAIDLEHDKYVAAMWARLDDPEVRAAIGRDLDGLLDRHPFARRRQLDLVIAAVLKAAGIEATP